MLRVVLRPGDLVTFRDGRVIGDAADVKDDGTLLGRPTTWRIRFDALTKVG
jgi:hypothetical protein